MNISIDLDPSAVLFYTRVAAVSGKSLPAVLADALFLLAGELSLEAIRDAENPSQKPL